MSTAESEARARGDGARFAGEVGTGVFEVAARAGRAHVLHLGVDAVEGEAFRGRAGPVVLAHPGDQLPVWGQFAAAERDAFAHHLVEVAGPLLDMGVHGQRGHAVGFQGDRAEALIDELGEQFVADAREGRFLVGRFAEGQEVARRGHEVSNVLTHEPRSYP